MALLTVQNSDELVNGTPTYVAATLRVTTESDTFRNDDDHIAIWSTNAGAAKKLVVVYGRDSNFGPYPSYILAIPGSSLQISQMFTGSKFNDANGLISFYYTDTTGNPDDPGVPNVTSLTIAVVRYRRI